MTREISINAEYLRLAQLFSSKDDNRYYLKGVHIEQHPSGEGIIIVATNGTVCGIFYDREGYVENKLLIEFSKPFITSLKSEKREHGRRVTIKNDRLVVMTINSDGSMVNEEFIKPGNIEIDDTFPDWRRILPKDFSNDSLIIINPKEIEVFSVVASSLTNSKLTPITFNPSGKHGPIGILCGHDDFFGIVMPMKVGKSMKDVNSWLL